MEEFLSTPVTDNTSPSSTVVQSSLNYLKCDPSYAVRRAYYIEGPLAPDLEAERTNFQYERVGGIEFHDIRGFEDKLDLDRDGFCFLKREINLPRVWSSAESDRVVGEIKRDLGKKLGAEFIMCYDYKFRHSDPAVAERSKNTYRSLDTPHADQTLTGARNRLAMHLSPSQLAKYLDGKWRVQILNTWRPLRGPVQDAPLAFCDYFSIEPDDLIHADRISPHSVREIYYLSHNPKQRWVWLRGQGTDEMVVFRSWDSLAVKQASEERGKTLAKFCVHTSFKNPEAPADAPPRESLEARFIVVTPLKEAGK